MIHILVIKILLNMEIRVASYNKKTSIVTMKTLKVTNSQHKQVPNLKSNPHCLAKQMHHIATLKYLSIEILCMAWLHRLFLQIFVCQNVT